MSWQWSLFAVLLVCVALTGGAVWLAVRVVIGAVILIAGAIE